MQAMTKSILDTRDMTDIAEHACRQACKAIAPAWPLDRSIAVNPHWERIGMPVRRVAARMAVLGGIRVFPARDYMRQAWKEQRIVRDDLAHAIATVDGAGGLTPELCLEALLDPSSPQQLPLVIDVLDNAPRRGERLSWRDAVSHQIGQACAAYFDLHQGDWQARRTDGLYAFWRATLQGDHGIGVLMGLPDLHRLLAALPAHAAEAERWALARLNLDSAVWPDYLEAMLLTVNGWASYCAWRGWEARLHGGGDTHLRELLAVRLAWDAIVLDCRSDARTVQQFTDLAIAWDQAPVRIARAEDTLLADEVWQAALEAGYQRKLARQLKHPAGAGVDEAPEVQAAFCIDVRSERMRRAIEAVWPSVQTIGVAGFFGLPLAYTPLATGPARPQLPGLLAPRIEVTDCVGSGSAQVAAARRDRFALQDGADAMMRWPGAAFCSVESAGFTYLARLWRWIRPGAGARPRDHLAGLPMRYRARSRPDIEGMAPQAKATLAAAVLRTMGLDKQFAPLVLLVGHASQSHNNAHAASLDCGACGGNSGEINARTLAGLLNNPEVRTALAEQGIPIPASTWFVAAVHNTTTDEIEGFDLDLLPKAARASWDKMALVLEQAGDQVRRERATSLGLNPRARHSGLLDALKRRANDGAQTRPEWGLAGNAAFVIAPRARTAGAVLDGRCFLHDYEASRDPDGSLLEALMTAPMVVANWINWQYHASTSDPARYGSGNKLLHNVVGGNIGVFEGNGGDLRIGIPRQSLHDGERWVHEPLRLTVVIDAPAAAIDAVLAKHQTVRDLVLHQWLHLWRVEGDQILRRTSSGWDAAA